MDSPIHRPPLELDDMSSDTHQLRSILECQALGVVTHEWHVAHDERTDIAPLYGFEMIENVFHGHRQGRVVTLDHHAKGIAHQHDLDADTAGNFSESRIVGRDASETLALGLERGESPKCDARLYVGTGH